MIVAETGWLNDEIINVAQILLKNQGVSQHYTCYHLTSCVLSSSKFCLMETHWVTISIVGLPQPARCINAYDSLYETLTDFTKGQICALLCSGEHCIYITARLMKVHKQKNMSDCGLLATAYATSIYAMVMMSVLFSMLACSMKMRAHLVNGAK